MSIRILFVLAAALALLPGAARADDNVPACAPHWQVMNGRLAAFPPSTTPPAAPAPKTLRATIAAGGALSLSARRVAPGRYRLTVADRSPTRTFHLVGPGVNRRTARAFVGTAAWTLTLARGTYRFGSDPRLSGRLVVE